jgi:hypothetical protein
MRRSARAHAKTSMKKRRLLSSPVVRCRVEYMLHVTSELGQIMA